MSRWSFREKQEKIWTSQILGSSMWLLSVKKRRSSLLKCCTQPAVLYRSHRAGLMQGYVCAPGRDWTRTHLAADSVPVPPFGQRPPEQALLRRATAGRMQVKSRNTKVHCSLPERLHVSLLGLWSCLLDLFCSVMTPVVYFKFAHLPTSSHASLVPLTWTITPVCKLLFSLQCC